MVLLTFYVFGSCFRTVANVTVSVFVVECLYSANAVMQKSSDGWFRCFLLCSCDAIQVFVVMFMWHDSRVFVLFMWRDSGVCCCVHVTWFRRGGGCRGPISSPSQMVRPAKRAEIISHHQNNNIKVVGTTPLWSKSATCSFNSCPGTKSERQCPETKLLKPEANGS